jgi:hypothetical protein
LLGTCGEEQSCRPKEERHHPKQYVSEPLQR